MTNLDTNFDPALNENRSLNKIALYFGEDIIINDNFKIHQPSVQEIMDLGEDELFPTLNVFIGNPTMYRLALWKQGIDWNKIGDFELFMMLVTSLERNKATSVLFGDIDFSKLQYGVLSNNTEDSEKLVLYDLEQDILIDEDLFLFIRESLRYMFNIYPKNEYAKGKTTKEWIIQEEFAKLEQQKDENKKEYFLPFISFCINHPGFKYKSSELKEIGIVELMDSVKQLQHNENVIALLHGANSGFVDVSKISPEKFNFIRDDL